MPTRFLVRLIVLLSTVGLVIDILGLMYERATSARVFLILTMLIFVYELYRFVPVLWRKRRKGHAFPYDT